MFRYVTSPSKSLIFTTLALVVLLVVLSQSGVGWWLSIAMCVVISIPVNLVLASIDRRRITESAYRESEQEQGHDR